MRNGSTIVNYLLRLLLLLWLQHFVYLHLRVSEWDTGICAKVSLYVYIFQVFCCVEMSPSRCALNLNEWTKTAKKNILKTLKSHSYAACRHVVCCLHTVCWANLFHIHFVVYIVRRLSDIVSMHSGDIWTNQQYPTRITTRKNRRFSICSMNVSRE